MQNSLVINPLSEVSIPGIYKDYVVTHRQTARQTDKTDS